jgi:hypothetical protein
MTRMKETLFSARLRRSYTRIIAFGVQRRRHRGKGKVRGRADRLILLCRSLRHWNFYLRQFYDLVLRCLLWLSNTV